MSLFDLLDDVSEMLALSDAELDSMELSRSTLENQLASILSDLAETGLASVV